MNLPARAVEALVDGAMQGVRQIQGDYSDGLGGYCASRGSWRGDMTDLECARWVRETLTRAALDKVPQIKGQGAKMLPDGRMGFCAVGWLRHSYCQLPYEEAWALEQYLDFGAYPGRKPRAHRLIEMNDREGLDFLTIANKWEDT